MTRKTKTLGLITIVLAMVSFFLSEGYDSKSGLIGSIMDPNFGICLEHHSVDVSAQYNIKAYSIEVCGKTVPYRWILALLAGAVGIAAVVDVNKRAK